MDEAARESEARFAAYVDSLASVLGACGPCGSFEGLLHRVADAWRAQERRADRVDRGSGARRGGASVAVALRRPVGVVGRSDAGEGS